MLPSVRSHRAHQTHAGTWLAWVERPSGTVEVRLHLAPTGAAFLVAGAWGAGRWHSRGSRLCYRIWEAVVDGHGYQGYVDIRQRGEVTAGAFHTEGDSFIYDAAGSLLRTVAVRITGLKEKDDYRSSTFHDPRSADGLPAHGTEDHAGQLRAR